MKLIQGDCLEEMQKLIDEGIKVDMVLTDPPYGTTVCSWDTVIPFEPMWNCLKQITSLHTPILLFSNDKWGGALKMSNMEMYKYQWVWNKEFSSNFMQAKKSPLIPLEYINVFYQKQPLYNPQKRDKTIDYDATRISKSAKKKNITTDGIHGRVYHRRYYEDDGKRYPINLITLNSQRDEVNNSNRLHPSQKPIKLLEYLIKTYTKENDLVLDFTMGSGSTGVACLQTNRNFIGIELDEKYYNIAKKRCSEYQSKLW